MIGLVDCQSFYCSCESVFRPDLKDKPIIVLSNNDHWIIALNPEAKALGLKRGLRFKESRKIIDNNNVVFFSSNYTLYNDISWRVMENLRNLSPQVEIYSIDEAFIDLFGFKNLKVYGEVIRKTIKKQTRIPTTIGIAPTKSLAKVAQRLAKQMEGSLLLETAGDISRALTITPVKDLWGIGSAYAKKLELAGIRTAADFINIPEWVVKKEMTSVGWLLQRELKGIPMAELTVEVNPRKGIISARQFSKPVKDLSIIDEAISYYAELAVDKLRKQACTTNFVTVSLEAFGRARHASAETTATDYLPDIISVAKALLKKIYSPDFEYWRTTIFLFGIEPVSGKQINFFDYNSSKKGYLLKKVDEINDKYGQHAIHPCASEFREDWGMHRNYLSPNYTTRIKDFPVAQTLFNK
ncbi:MAG: SOS mutagenesis and repair protein UmuC [Spirochaetes bacterium]|nr:MAG: SOS mutagenesis and repair protein UmuC [Spirochaetota bacterium]